LRSPRTAACLVATLGLALAGCGSSKATVQGGNDTLSATTLTVYSNLPLLGSDATSQQSIVDGEALALYNAGGRVQFKIGGRSAELHVSLDSLNDADAAAGGWTAEATAASAKTAFQDLSAVAYIGDFDSGATATSLPLNDENDVVQVSPGSPYVGFTDPAPGVPKDEPHLFYPYWAGHRTFARLVPSYLPQARATIAYMRSLGVRRLYLLSDSADPLDAEIVPLVAADLRRSGIALAGSGSVAPSGITPAAFTGLARRIAAAHPDAVIYGGAADVSAPVLWRALHAQLPAAKLFAPSTLAVPVFLGGLGPAAAATYVTSPYLEPDQYPAPARAVLRQLARLFPGVAATVYALYGYEAMEVVLDAIHRAGRDAPSRGDFRNALFSLGEIRDSVIGPFRIDAAGDSSLDAFDGYRVGAGGALVLVRQIS
jgi:branched-chain amino acid transport system substrate-binding protein